MQMAAKQCYPKRPPSSNASPSSPSSPQIRSPKPLRSSPNKNSKTLQAVMQHRRLWEEERIARRERRDYLQQEMRRLWAEQRSLSPTGDTKEPELFVLTALTDKQHSPLKEHLLEMNESRRHALDDSHDAELRQQQVLSESDSEETRVVADRHTFGHSHNDDDEEEADNSDSDKSAGSEHSKGSSSRNNDISKIENCSKSPGGSRVESVTKFNGSQSNVETYQNSLQEDLADASMIRLLLLEAERAMEDSEFARAVALANKILQKSKQNVEAFYIRGEALRQLGKLAAAVDDLGFALAISPNHARSHHCRGLCLLDMHDPKRAAAHFKLALKHQGVKEEALTLVGLGRALQALGYWDAARHHFDQAVSIGPCPYAYFCRGYLRRELGDEIGAREDMHTVLALDENFGEYYSRRASAAEMRGDFQTAVNIYSTLIENLPLKPHVRSSLQNRMQSAALRIRK